MKFCATERGAALLLALAAISLLSAVAVVMIMGSSSEMLMAGAFRDQRSGVYAADAIAVRALDEIAAADWSLVLSGAALSSLVDGSPGVRTLADGTAIDLRQIVNMANCQKSSACTPAELTAVTEQRPWGSGNPVWQLYAYGPLAGFLPSSASAAPWYVTLSVADDPLHADELVALRAEAFGPRNAHAVVELLAARSSEEGTDYNGGGSAGVTILSWREVR